jgi:hypothetical protein
MDILELLVAALKLGTVLIQDVEDILAQAKSENWQDLSPKIEASTEAELKKLEDSIV